MQRHVERHIMFRYLKIETQGNCCWPEVYIRKNHYGQNHNVYVPIFCSDKYPDIKKAYYLSMRLGFIYHQFRHKDVALTKLARWYDKVNKSEFLAFGRVARLIQTHYLEIIIYFEKRSTNTASESFNAKIKNFRSQVRGVKDRTFCLDCRKFMRNLRIPQFFTLIHFKDIYWIPYINKKKTFKKYTLLNVFYQIIILSSGNRDWTGDLMIMNHAL